MCFLSAFNYGKGAMRRRIIKDETFSFHCFFPQFFFSGLHLMSIFSTMDSKDSRSLLGFSHFHFISFSRLSAALMIFYFMIFHPGRINFFTHYCGCEWTLDCVWDKRKSDRSETKNDGKMIFVATERRTPLSGHFTWWHITVESIWWMETRGNE